MKLLIVRHGQTAANLESVVQTEDSRLSKTGRKQAQALARHLKDERIDAAYFSDLPRAAETADIILSFHRNAKRTPAKELREKDSGAFAGKPYEAYHRARKTSGVSFFEFRAEGGESIADVQRRVASLYEALRAQHKDETVLLVSHQGTIVTLLLYLLEKPFENYADYRMDNTALTVVEVNEGGDRTFHLINSIAHIPRRLVPALYLAPLTPLYDSVASALGYGSVLQRKVLQAAQLQDGGRVIDIGCGTGSFLIELKKALPNTEATGVDADPRMLALAEQKLKRAGVRARLEEKFAEWLLFPPYSFNAAVSVLTFHRLSFSAKKRMAKEVHRILAPGGSFLLADFGARKHIPLIENAGFAVTEAAPRWRMIDFLLAKKR